MAEVKTARLEIKTNLPGENLDQLGHDLTSLRTPGLELRGKSDGKTSLIDIDDSIGILMLSPRILNRLEDNKIFTVRDLISKCERDLQALKLFGPITLREIKQALEERGLSLKSVQQ